MLLKLHHVLLFLVVPVFGDLKQDLNFIRNFFKNNIWAPLVHPGSIHLEKQWFNQKLDHFSAQDNRTWNQLYYVNRQFQQLGGPIFLMIQGEVVARKEWLLGGYMAELGESYGALLMTIEHRFYGESIPNMDLSLTNLKYFTSDQAIEDLSYFIQGVEEVKELKGCKIILFGGSYAGNLGTWFKAKYPTLVHGVIASSAPLLAKMDFSEYLWKTGKDLEEIDPNCYSAVKEAFHQLQEMSSTEEGLTSLAQLFKMCKQLNHDDKLDIANFIHVMAGNFGTWAQENGNSKYGGKLNSVCSVMVDKQLGSAVERLARCQDSTQGMCYSFEFDQLVDLYKNEHSNDASYIRKSEYQWLYQSCNEFGYFQTESSSDTPFGQKAFSIDLFLNLCQNIFSPHMNYEFISNAVRNSNNKYGGKSPNVTDVVFVHGSLDPWSELGITNTTSPNLGAILIKGSSHCGDMYSSSDNDLPGLVEARKYIEEAIRKFLM